LFFECVDFDNGFAVLFEQPIVAAAENFLSDVCQHE
jgi:hypothetical protein